MSNAVSENSSVPAPLLCGEIVLDAMRIAEWAHRTRYRKGGAHYRKAPAGLDRPSYFLHLAQVAWMLEAASMDAQVVAAGYLHDTLEDTTVSEDELRSLVGSDHVVALIKHVTEPPKSDEVEDDWESRNGAYLDRIARAPRDAVALSCADKTANLIDFTLLMREGHPIESFASRPFLVQLGKFQKLRAVFIEVPAELLARFDAALVEFKAAGERLLQR